MTGSTLCLEVVTAGCMFMNLTYVSLSLSLYLTTKILVSQTGRQVYAWYAGAERPGIYELDWQQTGKLNRIAMCLENRSVGIVDVSRVPALMRTPSKPS